MTKDKLNYDDNSVDNIYVSHVIEHFTDQIVQNFFDDATRILKFGGVLRLCCPDAKFLFNVSSFKNNYWKWRYQWLKERNISPDTVTQIDFLIGEIATRKLRFFNYNDKNINQQIEKKYDYDFVMKLLTADQKFEQKFAFDHINFFDFEKINNFLIVASKKNAITDFRVVESKPNGSISIDMQQEEFDKHGPQMSLYVDYLKLR
jgi:SAM-dependent methyltransferase